MCPTPFLIVALDGKKDVLVLRRKARLVARLLSFAPRDVACIAAGSFLVGWQALRQRGRSTIGFAIEAQQLHVFVVSSQVSGASLRLSKRLPSIRKFAEQDVAWLVESLSVLRPGNLFEEVEAQNEEVLILLRELQARGDGEVAPVEKPGDPSAA
jgi:hypothetical protein